jgi:hypothetical protein
MDSFDRSSPGWAGQLQRRWRRLLVVGDLRLRNWLIKIGMGYMHRQYEANGNENTEYGSGSPWLPHHDSVRRGDQRRTESNLLSGSLWAWTRWRDGGRGEDEWLIYREGRDRVSPWDEGSWSSSVMAMMAISGDSRCTEMGFKCPEWNRRLKGSNFRV